MFCISSSSTLGLLGKQIGLESSMLFAFNNFFGETSLSESNSLVTNPDELRTYELSRFSEIFHS